MALVYRSATMSAVTASEARANLYRLIDEVAASHDPLLITGKRGNAVLLSETDWNAIQETLHLLSIPGMRESIREGVDTPVDECDEELDW
jgi:prevent-host-death family protein